MPELAADLVRRRVAVIGIPASATASNFGNGGNTTIRIVAIVVTLVLIGWAIWQSKREPNTSGE